MTDTQLAENNFTALRHFNPFNAGIKSLCATRPDEDFTGNFVS
jgi:hypothetical protein